MTQKEAQTFEDKVRSMTVAQIIMAMVQGLRKRWVKVNMNTYGDIQIGPKGKIVCWGCAATNTVFQIAKIKPSFDTLQSYARGWSWGEQARMVGTNTEFLREFEIAINDLRQGHLGDFNVKMKYDLGLPTIPRDVYTQFERKVPILTSNYTKGDLEVYVALAKACGDYEKSRQETA